MFVITLNGALRGLRSGRTVRWRPLGNSMRPAISSFSLVRLIPAGGVPLAVGDIVLAEVGGNHYLHRIAELDTDRHRALISGDDGVVNGWAALADVVGVCTHVRGRPVRPRVSGGCDRARPGAA